MDLSWKYYLGLLVFLALAADSVRVFRKGRSEGAVLLVAWGVIAPILLIAYIVLGFVGGLIL